MISRAHRFHGRGGLKFVYQNGRTVRGPLFSIKSVINSRRKTYRVSIVVSRKVNKSAVVRNRIRRRLYEAVRANEPNIVEPYDIIITVFHSSLASEPSESLEAQLKKQLSESGVLVKRVTS